jgi:hypothetical protein
MDAGRKDSSPLQRKQGGEAGGRIDSILDGKLAADIHGFGLLDSGLFSYIAKQTQ